MQAFKIHIKKQRGIWKLLFWSYITVLFLVVVIKFEGSFLRLINKIESVKGNRAMGLWKINLIPFRSIGPQLAHINQDWAFTNIAGNILAFMPFGFLLPLAYPKCRGVVPMFIISFLSVLLIETFQLITMLGTFDVDDIILNVPGIMLGYGLLVLLQSIYSGHKGKKGY